MGVWRVEVEWGEVEGGGHFGTGSGFGCGWEGGWV